MFIWFTSAWTLSICVSFKAGVFSILGLFAIIVLPQVVKKAMKIPLAMRSIRRKILQRGRALTVALAMTCVLMICFPISVVYSWYLIDIVLCMAIIIEVLLTCLACTGSDNQVLALRLSWRQALVRRKVAKRQAALTKLEKIRQRFLPDYRQPGVPLSTIEELRAAIETSSRPDLRAPGQALSQTLRQIQRTEKVLARERWCDPGVRSLIPSDVPLGEDERQDAAEQEAEQALKRPTRRRSFSWS